MLFQEVLFHALHQVIVVKVSQKAYWDHDVEVCSCLARQLLNLSVSVCCVGLAAAHGWILSLVPPALWGLWIQAERMRSVQGMEPLFETCTIRDFQLLYVSENSDFKRWLNYEPTPFPDRHPRIWWLCSKKKKKKMFLEKMCLLPWHLQPELMGCTLDKMFIL